MYQVSYTYKDVSDTATMSDDSEIKAVFHAGIALGLQYLENTSAGAVLEMLKPGTFDKVLNEMDKFVRDGQISAKQV